MSAYDPKQTILAAPPHVCFRGYERTSNTAGLNQKQTSTATELSERSAVSVVSEVDL